MAKKKKKKDSGKHKSPATRAKVHKLAKRIGKSIGKNVKGNRAAKLRVYHGIAFGEVTGLKPKGGVRKIKKKKSKKKKKK